VRSRNISQPNPQDGHHQLYWLSPPNRKTLEGGQEIDFGCGVLKLA
jgi:hypothetical protein